MVIQVANYISDIEPYEGGRPISEVARELGIPENKIIKLASNENPIGISQFAKVAINNALKEVERYPDGNGFHLKKIISEKFSITPNQIILGNGSNDILELAARTFVTLKDEIIYSQHAFAVYKLVTKAIGAKGVEVSATKYCHDLNKFSTSITKKTKLIFIANPNNPTGTLIDKKTLKSFLDSIPKHIVVVLDEAYDEYLLDDLKSNSFEWIDNYRNLIVSRSFSKAYGLAGLRIGYGVGSPNLIELMNRVRQPFNVNHLAQEAAIASLNDKDFIEQSRKLNNEGMSQIVQAFKKLNIEFIPSYGNFVSFKLQDEKTTMLYYHHLLKNGVIVRPISNYDLPEFLRVSIGLKKENKIFIKYLSNCNI